MELLTNVGFGILGGLILNVMPCVFPVLFFKLSRLVEHADEAPGKLRTDAVAYLGGTWLAFGAFAGLVVGLKSAGETVGWGMHMQNPGFVAALVVLLYVFGLNALGVFELRVGFSGGGPTSGWKASFFDGLLITLVSTPCSAPFLGGAAAAALAKDAAWYETLTLFWAVGLGLALPVLLIGFVPALNRLLPRPGAWMTTFKALTGFTLIGAAVWLFETFDAQVSAAASQGFLYFLLALGAALWALSHFEELGWHGAKRNLGRLGSLAVVVAALVLFVRFDPPEARADGGALPAGVEASVEGDAIKWTPFSATVKDAVLAQGRPIFVDYTADWCASCKTFEKTHIETDEIRALLGETLILAAKADLTRQDDALWKELSALGRSALPTYVIYRPDGTHTLLPEGPPTQLAEQLTATSRAFPPESFRPAEATN